MAAATAAAIGAGLATIGGGSAVAGGISVGSSLVGAGLAVKGQKDAKKAASQANNAAQSNQVNLQELDAQTREISESNAVASAALESRLNPELAALRTQTIQSISQGINRSPEEQGLYNQLRSRLGQGADSPLLQSAVQRAQSDLDLGGQLPLDVRNLVARTAASKAGTVGQNLGFGRDITARDLGLTSLDLQNQRLQNASALGGQELGMNQFNAGNFLNQFQALQSANNNQRSFNLGAGQFAAGIPMPVVGIDPGSAANLAVGNQNASQAAQVQAAQIRGAGSQGLTKLGGQFLGFGLSGMGAK